MSFSSLFFLPKDFISPPLSQLLRQAFSLQPQIFFCSQIYGALDLFDLFILNTDINLVFMEVVESGEGRVY